MLANHRFTLKLGTHESPNELRNELKKQMYCVSGWAESMMGAIQVGPPEVSVDVEVVSAIQLGFRVPVMLKEISDIASEVGLRSCPPECGPQLRLQYPHQPKWESIHLAMDPIPDRGGKLRIFSVEHTAHGAWLFDSNGLANKLWPPQALFAFVRAE